MLPRAVAHASSHVMRRSPPPLRPATLSFALPLPLTHRCAPPTRPPLAIRLLRLRARPFCIPAAPAARTAAARSARAITQSTQSTPPPSSTSPTALVIVESPAKAATIQKILPEPRYRVRSCVGHIRELPGSAKRIPAKYKHEPWARLGVDVEDDFRPLYVLIAGKQSIISDLKAELRGAVELILATDEDREGEAISWHLMEVLKPEVPVRRAVFHEITPEAIKNAVKNCRGIDLGLVQAQETRRVLDRLAGYTMSPLLWKKIAKGLSAGRVQSVAMAAIVRRELSRLRFVRAEYCGCVATFIDVESGKKFSAALSAVDGVRMVKGVDFEDQTGSLSEVARAKGMRVFNRAAMEEFRDLLDVKSASVRSVDKKRITRNPPTPLITSTLQQECGNKLGMGAGRTMRIAQKLYESGLITYMRTDNPNLSEQAVSACRGAVIRLYGEDALWNGEGGPRGTKPKAAQAAHEAIRPAGSTFTLPDDLPALEEDEAAVYRLIFRRTLASQMVGAELDQTTIKIHVPINDATFGKVAEFRATGSVIVNMGFLRVYEAGDAGQKANSQESSSFLPPVSSSSTLQGSNLTILEHETKPPARYNDASLVKELEELGVGRPSTYASIIEKLITRGYVYRGNMLGEEKAVPARALVPSLSAFAVERLLAEHFPSFVDAQFTARMEEALDEIAAGSAERTNYLKGYYCGHDGLAASVERTGKEISPVMFKRIVLPNMPKEMIEDEPTAKSTDAIQQKTLKTPKRPKKKVADAKATPTSTDSDASVEWSRTRVLISSYGPYVEQDGTVVASLPKSTLADDLSADRLESVLQIAKDPELGTDPRTGKALLLKTSRYGPYVQLGRDEDAPEGTKPKRCGLFPGMDVGTLTIDLASQLLSLPRLLGTHPDTGQEVRAAMGPYGPYVVHEGTYVSLKKDVNEVLNIEFEEALELLLAAEHRKEVRREKQALKKAEAETQPQKSQNRTSAPKKSAAKSRPKELKVKQKSTA